MTRLPRNVNMAAVVVPLLIVVVAVPLLWGSLVGPSDLAVFAVMYVLCGLGVTVGYHRMLTHRAFQAHPATRYAFAILGSMAVQGPVIEWVADHRKHHAHTDQEGDPHSPHIGHGAGSGTPTWAGSGAPTARPAPTSTPANSSRTPACDASTAPSRGSCSRACWCRRCSASRSPEPC